MTFAGVIHANGAADPTTPLAARVSHAVATRFGAVDANDRQAPSVSVRLTVSTAG